MGIQGQLRDMSLTDLIQFNCFDGETALITLDEAGAGLRAVLFIENGQLAHAEMGDRHGEDVVVESLTWADGTFQLEPDVPSPTRTIHRSHASLLLEGM